MSFEIFKIGYAKWFDIRVEHRYFLNYGLIPYEQTSPDDIKLALKRISQQYDITQFWQIQPDLKTKEFLKNQKIVFKNIPNGCRIGIGINNDRSPFIELPESFKLTFEIVPTDGYFMIYTDIAKEVSDLLSKTTTVIENGKEVIRNRIFKLKNKVNSEELNTNETINQADIIVFVPQEGRIQRPPLGIIEIEHNNSISLLDNNDKIASPAPNFRIVLKNRHTKWKYQETPIASTFPLVNSGRVLVESGGKKVPNASPSNTFFDNTLNDYYSLIF